MGSALNPKKKWVGNGLKSLIPLVLLFLGFRGDASAQQNVAGLSGTPEELLAYNLYNQDKLITARAKAEHVLQSNPDSIIASYVEGCVLREAEGSLARSMYYLGHARETYESRWGVNRPPGAPWHLHEEILFKITQVAGEIEEYEYELEMLEFHDSLYDPDLVAEHAWPLLHLGRFNEARDWARRGIALSDAWEHSLGLNAMCAIEAEARTRRPQYDACIAALENARRRAAVPSDPRHPEDSPHVAVHAFNASLAALSMLKHDEARTLCEEGVRQLEFTPANPWRNLAYVHVGAGRAQEAIDSVRQMQSWRARQPAQERDQDHAESDIALATVLLVVGEVEPGWRFADRAVRNPDRRGLTSSKPEQALGANALLRRVLTRTRAELHAEHASGGSFGERTWGAISAWWEKLGSLSDDERVEGVLADDTRLVSTLRMYVRGGIEPVPTWLVGELVEVVGPGVVAAGLAQARAQDHDFRDVEPWHDAIGAEVALGEGDEARAIELADRALAHLPRSESLLMARTAAVAAEAARNEGDDAKALGYYGRVMQLDPGTIRRMGLSLPARVVSHGGGLVGDAADDLGHSPRLREDAHGFAITVSGAGDRLSAVLSSPQGDRLTEVISTRIITHEQVHGRDHATRETDDHLVRRFVDEFHDHAFALRVTISSTDMRSLDGSTTGGTDATREQMRQMLDGLTDDSQPPAP